VVSGSHEPDGDDPHSDQPAVSVGRTGNVPGSAQANANDVLTFWATGGGRTNPPLDDSIAVTPLSPLYYLASPPQVLVDGHAAIVTYAGLAPGETPD